MKRFIVPVAVAALMLFVSAQPSQAGWGHRRHARIAHRHAHHYHVHPRHVHVRVAPVVVAPSYHTYGVRTYYRGVYPVHGTYFYGPGYVSYGFFH